MRHRSLKSMKVQLGPHTASEERLLRISDLVSRLAVSRSTVMTLLATGEIASLTVGRSRRVRFTDLARYIEARAEADPSRSGKPLPDAGQSD